MKNSLFVLSVAMLLCVSGCAGIEPPQPKEILAHPLGLGPIRVGMTKDEVAELWGDPDLIKDLGQSEDMGRTSKEKWIYYGRVTNLPVNYGYLAKPLHLYFDGNNLTSFKEE